MDRIKSKGDYALILVLSKNENPNFYDEDIEMFYSHQGSYELTNTMFKSGDKIFFTFYTNNYYTTAYEDPESRQIIFPTLNQITDVYDLTFNK